MEFSYLFWEKLANILSVDVVAGRRFKSLAKQRSNYPKVLFKNGVFENFAKFTGKYLCWSLLFNKVRAPGQVFSCGFCEIFRSTYFLEHLQTVVQ